MQNVFHGLGIALITPFKEDGSIDYDALVSLVEYQLANGADFFCILATTGEAPCLTREEKDELTRVVKKVVNGRVPILKYCGGNNTAAVVDEIKTTDWQGIDGILSICPYYNKPSQEGLYQHFKAIAKASPLPIVLYNVPGRVGVNMTAETTVRIASEFTNVVAIKEASGNLEQVDEIIKNKPKHFEVISGDDALTFPMIASGAVGVISVIGNAYPEEFGAMVHAAQAGDYTSALSQHRQFSRLYKLMSVDGNPSGIKGLLYIQGKVDNVVRLPLVPVRVETLEAIRHYVED